MIFSWIQSFETESFNNTSLILVHRWNVLLSPQPTSYTDVHILSLRHASLASSIRLNWPYWWALQSFLNIFVYPYTEIKILSRFRETVLSAPYLINLSRKIAGTYLPGLNSSEKGSQQSALFPNPWSFGQLFFPHTKPGIQSESSVQSPSPAPHLCSEVQHPSMYPWYLSHVFGLHLWFDLTAQVPPISWLFLMSSKVRCLIVRTNMVNDTNKEIVRG